MTMTNKCSIFSTEIAPYPHTHFWSFQSFSFYKKIDSAFDQINIRWEISNDIINLISYHYLRLSVEDFGKRKSTIEGLINSIDFLYIFLVFKCEMCCKTLCKIKIWEKYRTLRRHTYFEKITKISQWSTKNQCMSTTYRLMYCSKFI